MTEPTPPRSLAPTFDQQVTVHQLRLLRAVADHGGFTRAATALGLSQPAISHQLKALSDAVGVPLVEVMGRKVHLTQAGRLLYEHARRILTDFEAAGIALDELRGLRRGMLRIAGDTTVGIYVLPDLLGAFREKHPDIELRLDVGNREHLHERIAANEVDFAVSGRRWEDPPLPLISEPFLANELIAIASPRHPFAKRDRVSLQELAREPFIVREPGSGTRETREEAFRDAGLTVHPVMELSSNGAIKRAVARNLGVAVLSRYAASLELEVGLLVEVRVVGFPLQRQWHLVYARDKALGPVDEEFLRFVRDGRWKATLGHALNTD